MTNAESGNRKRGPIHYKDNPIWDQSIMFTGPRKDIEATNSIPHKAKTRRLLKLARSHDVNGDDIIQIEELREWLLEAYSIWDYQDVRDAFMKADGNGNGRVTITEFLSDRHEGKTEKDAAKLEKRRKNGEKLSSKDEEFLRTLNVDKKRFTTADLNADSTLDENEFTMTVNPAEYPVMVDLDMKSTMDFADVDKNGLITMNEFVNQDAPREARKVAEDKFKELDMDKDLALSYEEMRLYMLPNNADSLHKEIDTLKKDVDKNNDNQITMEEMLAADDRFLFGPITDYTRNLLYVKDEHHPEDEEDESEESTVESVLRNENHEEEKANNDEKKSQMDESKTKPKQKRQDGKEKSSKKEKTSKKDKSKAKVQKEKPKGEEKNKTKKKDKDKNKKNKKDEL